MALISYLLSSVHGKMCAQIKVTYHASGEIMHNLLHVLALQTIAYQREGDDLTAAVLELTLSKVGSCCYMVLTGLQ